MMEVKIVRHKIARPSRLSLIKHRLRGTWWYLLTAGLLLLVIPAKHFPNLVEQWYTRGWYAFLAHTYGFLTSLVPFSLVEMGILFLIILYLWLLAHGVSKWRRRELLEPYIKKILVWTARGVSLTVAVFMIFCGYNYYRLPFAQTGGFAVRDSSVEELAMLCAELTQSANSLRSGLPADEMRTMKLSEGSFSLARQARDVFSGLSEKYPDLIPDYPVKPKPVLNSWAMSLMQITGVFCPVTFEANINVDAPDYVIPATMCHELAHSRGYMREDEANFLAYLACRESASQEFQYSGVMLALLHVQNRLYDADRNLFYQVTEQMSGGVWEDFAYNDAYWANYEGPVGDVSTAVNDTFLRLNDQADGVQSYGRMVDLLLADYRARHGILS